MSEGRGIEERREYFAETYYRLRDSLSDAAKASDDVHEAGRLYGLDTPAAVELLRKAARADVTADLASLLVNREHTITNALRVFAKHMSTAADEAQAAHERGDESAMVANSGYAMAAQLFRENAGRALTVADEIDGQFERLNRIDD